MKIRDALALLLALAATSARAALLQRLKLHMLEAPLAAGRGVHLVHKLQGFLAGSDKACHA
jgi:hypothetical protein